MPSTQKNPARSPADGEDHKAAARAKLLLRLFKATVVACFLAAVLGLLLYLWGTFQGEPNLQGVRILFGLSVFFFVAATLIIDRLRAFLRNHQ